MSEHYKMSAFGRYLTEGVIKYRTQLASECADVTKPIDTIRLRSGHLEAYTEILNVFTELYEGDLETFKKDYIDGYKEKIESYEEENKKDYDSEEP
jgi:hypothetical protein